MNSQIIRMNGPINKVNDEIIGGVAGISGDSKFAGQLGMSVEILPSNIIFDSTVGTLYGGTYRYVHFREGDTNPYTPGMLMFWNTTLTDWQEAYEVTNDEDLSSVDTAIMIAGIYIGGVSVGSSNYGYIQTEGMVPVKFRAALTAAGAVGSRVFAAGAGLGVDEALADVIDSANPTLFSDVSLMMGRFLGRAVQAPTNGGLKNVVLGFKNAIA